MQVLFSLSALLMLTLHKTLTHVEPKLFVGSFVVCAIGSCAYLAKNSGMGELDISGKKVSSSPTPSLDSYKLLAHFTQRATHHSHTIYILLATILATAIPIRCVWPSATTLSELPLHLLTGAAGPLRRLGHQHSPHALPALRPGWRGGHVKRAIPAVVSVLYTARPHTHTHTAPPGEKSVRRGSGLRSTPTGRGGRHRVMQSALFEGLCSGTAPPGRARVVMQSVTHPSSTHSYSALPQHQGSDAASTLLVISTFLLFLLATMVALCTERLKAAWCVAACLLYALTVYNLHSEVAGTLSAQDQQACTARKIRKLTLRRGG